MSDMPTSPVSTPEIDIVFADGPSAIERAAPAPSMRAEWRRLGVFLKRPTLDARDQNGAPLIVLLRVYALDMAIMLTLLTLAGALIAAGVELPRTAISEMEITIGLAALVVFVAPVLEELVFRGWLSGKPGWLVAVVIGALAAIAASAWGVSHTGDTAASGVAALMIGALVLSAIGLFLLRKRPTPGWFTAIFPGLFWLSASAFALIHIANFDEPNWWTLLPLVLPQLILGALAGYLRVRIGLWAAMALHALHNATVLGIAVLASLVA